MLRLPLPDGTWCDVQVPENRKSICIQNVQATTCLNITLDCARLAQEMPRTKYNVRTPHRIDLFLDHPKAWFALFKRQGKLVLMGGKSIAEAQEAVNALLEQLRACGQRIGCQALQRAVPLPLSINNLSTSGYLGYRVSLAALAMSAQHEEHATYENELFPGLRYRQLAPDVHASINATVFHSGKFLLLGCVTEHQVIAAYERLASITLPFAVNGSHTGDEWTSTNIDGPHLWDVQHPYYYAYT